MRGVDGEVNSGAESSPTAAGAPQAPRTSLGPDGLGGDRPALVRQGALVHLQGQVTDRAR
jgi:hypothetical protein